MLKYAEFSRVKATTKSGPHRVYGLVGDAHLQRQVIAAIMDWSLSEDARDFNLDTLDGESASVSNVLSVCGNLPFLSDRRVVVVQRAERVDNMHRAAEEAAEKEKSKGPGPVKRFSEALDTLPTTTVLILARTPETPEPGARAGTARCVHATVDKKIEKNGVVIDCTLNVKDSGQAVAILNSEAARRGIALPRDAAQHLVARLGNDVAGLLTELEKCSLAAGTGNPVTPAIIDEMTRRLPQDTVFNLTDAISARRAAHALGLTRELLQGGEPVERLLSYLASHFRQLLQARTLLDAGYTLDAGVANRMPAHLSEQFPQEGRDNVPSRLQAQAWLGRKYTDQARNFTVTQLEAALAALFDADLALKGIAGDGGPPELIVDLLVTRLCDNTSAPASRNRAVPPGK